MALPDIVSRAPDPDAELSAAPPVPPGHGRMRALLSNLALLLVSTLVSLGVAEVAVRIVAPQQLIVMRPDLWVPRDSVGYWNAPDLRTTVNTGERLATIITDRDGYRIGAAGRVEADETVLLLGDSFMKALQMDYELTLPGRLQEALPAARGRPVAVRAAGVDGWDPNQYLTFAASAAPVEQPRAIVVALYVGNDVVSERVAYRPPLAPSIRSELRVPRSLAPGELVDAVARPINDRLERSSHLFVFFKNRLAAMLMRAGLTGADFPWEIQKRVAPSPAWATTADVALEIARLGERHGARTVFVLIPSSYQVHREQFDLFVRGFGLDATAVDLEQPNRLLGGLLRERGLTVIDPLEQLRAAAERGERLFGTVDRHLSPDGHRVVLEAALPAVASALAGGGEPAPAR